MTRKCNHTNIPTNVLTRKMSFFCQAGFPWILFPWFQGVFSHVSIVIIRITSEHLALRGYIADLDHVGIDHTIRYFCFPSHHRKLCCVSICLTCRYCVPPHIVHSLEDYHVQYHDRAIEQVTTTSRIILCTKRRFPPYGISVIHHETFFEDPAVGTWQN